MIEPRTPVTNMNFFFIKNNNLRSCAGDFLKACKTPLSSLNLCFFAFRSKSSKKQFFVNFFLSYGLIWFQMQFNEWLERFCFTKTGKKVSRTISARVQQLQSQRSRGAWMLWGIDLSGSNFTTESFESFNRKLRMLQPRTALAPRRRCSNNLSTNSRLVAAAPLRVTIFLPTR